MNAAANFFGWRKLLYFALGIFVVSRFLFLSSCPIYNDESIYIHYAQKIHQNWRANRYISMAGGYNDWKPPLQYWVAAPFIEIGNDPLVPARVITILVSLAGLIGFYLFGKSLFGDKVGVISALLYALCPTVFLHSNQFTAEAFVFSTAAFFYWVLLKAIDQTRFFLFWGLLALFLGTALLLLKQSGLSLLALSLFLPFARLTWWAQSHRLHGKRPRLWPGFAIISLVVVGSKLLSNAILPAEFNPIRARFQQQWVMSARELLSLPIQSWRSNAEMLGAYLGSYYSWIAVGLFVIFLWRAAARRNATALTLGAMGLVSLAFMILCLRGFNEYLLNTAIIVFLLPALATLIAETCFSGANDRIVVRSGIAVAVITMLGFWVYQDALLGVSPGRYFERSTAWAKYNYLQRWSTGFGLKKVIAQLGREERAGIILADLHWGNPRTTLEIYNRKRFPNLKIIPVTTAFFDRREAEGIRTAAPGLPSARYAIYSADNGDGRPGWKKNLEDLFCDQREEVREYPSQMPIEVCTF